VRSDSAGGSGSFGGSGSSDSWSAAGSPRGGSRSADARPFVALKILVAGGFGVGKTTLVGAVSEVRPLHTEEVLTEAGRAVDDTLAVNRKRTTTVALDYGRITLRDDLALYLFGTPGQDRFWFLWDELARGALGAVVLADTRRLEDSFPAIDFFEHRDIPFIIAVNRFDDARGYQSDEVEHALDLDQGTPVMLCDARRRESGKEVLITLVEHASRRHRERRTSAADLSSPGR
jgi:signal recognition particle receptor subunit beta